MKGKAASEKREDQALNERVRRLKEEFALASTSPQIDTERVKFLLEIYRETETEPTIIRRAKLFHKLCSEKTIFIDENPIVGYLTKYKYGVQIYPEGSCQWMQRTNEFWCQTGMAPVTPEVREWIDKSVEKWKETNVFNMTQKVVQQSLGVDIRNLSKCGIGLELAPGGTQEVVPDYSKVLNKGLKGIIAEVEEQEAKLDVGNDGLSMWNFYQAVRITLDGMITLAQRYSALARQMVNEEKDLSRRHELERIAKTCERVPAYPAQNFYEAIQSVWFVILGVWSEANQALNSPLGRFTQYMYPFYKKDKEEGWVDDEKIIELLHLFFLKINTLSIPLGPHGRAFNQSRRGLQLSLGGLRHDGEDATNELDFLVLEAQKRIMLPEPLVNVMYHDRLSEKFLMKCVDLIRTGIGQPAFHNTRVAIERHLYHHRMTLEEARNVCVAGCVQSHIPGYMDLYWEGRLNIAKVFELALNDGKDPLSGIQLGPHSGDVETFQSYNELYQAFYKQMEYFTPLIHNISRIAWSAARNLPLPFGSALVNDCINKGKDLVDGGARYSFGDGVCFVGGIDVANSLLAIKKVVFDEKRINMKELKEALAANFEGHEEIQHILIGAPKYGNDDDNADLVAKGVYETCWKLHRNFADHLGRPIMASAYSVTGHHAFGRFTGTLPNGRKALKPLTDASVSAQSGTDRNGPTALVKSAAKVIDCVNFGSNHFNMKFHPIALKGTDGAKKLISLIKTYCDLGGYHVQFNCVSNETLKDAQVHPENYRNLVVRVAGFSAYFITLEKDVQDEIISRTELGF